MDTLLKIHNKLEFLHPVHGFADKVGAFGSLKPQNLEPKFHYKKSHIKLSKGFCVKASSSALLELVPETKKENLEFDLPMYDPSKNRVVDLAVVGGGLQDLQWRSKFLRQGFLFARLILLPS
ncbi:UNVERIFIED_CONTAM: Lycopene beta cyclase, chloroplastic [Sesamum radiatum]|uniref:Lycopene beta cyclase, chloroplastic n=1 Tax=Sesamum radiatum TaxID=300843 RepID=A0AAW2TJP2_SESRA